MRRFLIAIPIFLLLALVVQAQDGQFCMRAYEDRNSDGQLNPGEPLITHGLSANLINETGVVIETALIDTASTGSQGVICFQSLTPGQYTMEVNSAVYLPTTQDSLTVTISEDSQTRTELFEYGAIRADSVVNEPAETGDDELLDAVTAERLLISGLGALIAVLITLTVGFFILLILRWSAVRRLSRQGDFDPRRTTDTGSYPAIPPDDHDRFRPQ